MLVRLRIYLYFITFIFLYVVLVVCSMFVYLQMFDTISIIVCYDEGLFLSDSYLLKFIKFIFFNSNNRLVYLSKNRNFVMLIIFCFSFLCWMLFLYIYFTISVNKLQPFILRKASPARHPLIVYLLLFLKKRRESKTFSIF